MTPENLIVALARSLKSVLSLTIYQQRELSFVPFRSFRLSSSLHRSLFYLEPRILFPSLLSLSSRTAVKRIVRLFREERILSAGKNDRERGMNRSARPRHDLSYRRSFAFAYRAFRCPFERDAHASSFAPLFARDSIAYGFQLVRELF